MTNFKNLRPLEDERRKRQRLTYLNKHGRAGYKTAGSKGGRKSPTRFNSETARQASLKSWETRRARRKAAETEEQNENRLSTTQEN